MHRLPKFEEERHLAEILKSPQVLEAYEKLMLGAQIKKLRKKAGMKQEILAKKLKTTQSVVARMETGKQNFTLGTLIKIAFFLGKKLHVKFLL